MKKRLLAMLLVLMLVVSLLPVGALAADGDTVNRIRLMDKNAWGLAAIEKAGYSNEDVLWSNITSIRFFASDGSYTNWGVARDEVPDCYSHEGYLATDAGTKIVPSSVDRIVVELRFAYNGLEAGKIISATAVFHDEEFTLDYSEGAAGVREYAEFTLKSGQSYDKDYSVTFYFQPIGKADWELYDIVYVDAGTSIGSDMPAEPDYGSQDFVSWQTNKDGSGVTLTPETVINKDWVVYGTKTSAGGATAYHVMRDSTGGRHNALQDEVADIYNAENNTAYHSGNVEITAIQVNGNGGEHTNPDYFRNGWRESNRHYYIYNYNVDDVGLDNHQNTRIPVSEVTGITLTGIIDGNSFSVTIPKDELALQEISNPGTSDTIIEISVCDKLDGITKELVESAEDAPADVTGVSYPVNGKVTIPEDGRVTLLYKITVTGDQNAEYIVTDEGATAVSGSLRGELDANGIAEIYVTKTFSADDVVDGVLTNSASLKNDNTTLPPDDGNDKDEVKVEVEDEGGEEPEPEPEPEEPRDPTDTELSKLAVVLECTNGEVEHAEKAKTFHMRTTNCDLEIQQFGEEYICTVAPDYEKILSTYNTATEATHEYEDGGKQFTLIWSANTNAWEVAGDASITRQVKCETPEPELETVWVYAEVNGVMEEEPIWRGSAKYGASTVDYLNSNKASMPLTRDGYELEDGWFNYDHPGQQLNAETTINGWTNVYVKFTGKPQTVQVMIYRNGDITKPYATIDVPDYKTGDTIYTEDFDINDYYTKDKFATDFVFDGWFDDGRWNNYKDAGCPEEDFTTVDEIYVNGWKNVIAMVWDVYPVNYHVLDEDGNEIDNKTDYITERDLAGYELWDYSKAGHTFDGWYENDKDIGNDSKKEPVPLAPLKKYELYGLCDPIPQHLEIYAAIDKNKEEAVKIYSDMVDYGTPLVAYLETLELETDIFPGYSPEDGKWYKYDSPEWTFGENDTVSGWTNVLINYLPNEYTIYYHGNGGTTASGAEQSTSTFKYDSEATIKRNTFTYDGYVFIGWADDADGYNILYTGGEDVTFNTETFPGLLANGRVDLYAVWAEDKLGGGDDGNEPDGIADYRQVFVKYVAADENGSVTPSFNTFNLEVDENGKVMTEAGLRLSGVATPNADATFAYWTIEGLGYDGGAYSYEADLSGKDFTGYVAGVTYTFKAYFNGPVVKPEQPNVYKIYVTVHNGTATFCGSEVTSHILAAENEDITITFTPDEGYTLDYATIDDNMLLIPDDGVYTLKLVDSDHTIEVFYESDKIGTEDPNEGDGVPDKYQATVNFVAGENGEVTGDVTKVYTIFGADGKYAEEGVITPSLNGVTVTPDEGYKVDGWTNAAGERVNPESEITVEGGDVVVFTVNFQSDPSLKEITSFEKKLVTDRKTYHSFGLRVPTFIRNGSTVVVDEGKGVTLLYAISLTGTPGAEYAITDTGADVADGYALTGVIPETGVVTVYVTKDFTWREAAAAAYKDDALVNTAAVELTDNPNEPGQESTEEVDVVIDWDYNPPVVDDDDDEDDEVFVPNWLNTEDHYSYIVGYEDGTIKPNNNITRAEVATIFFRLLTDDARARYWSQTNDYTDVAADSWYNNAISTLSNMGIINGYEDGTFQPNASITRAEFTAIATRFFDYTAEYDGAFNDVSRSAWYADCVQAAVDMGLVDGYPDGGFHPNSNITRAEAVTIVNRVLNRAPHEDHLLDEDEMNVWPDNVYGAWYYADMQEATNSHDYDWIRVSGERVEEWTEKLPERDWAALEQEWSSAYSG